MNARSMPRTEPALDPVASQPAPPAVLELRVLGGPQAGAAIPWPEAGRALVLAVGDDAGETVDLQLAGDVPVRLRLRASLSGAANCEVLAGEVWLGDEVLATGVRFEWPMHVPLQLGGPLAIAFGEAKAGIWALMALAAEPAPAPAMAAETPPEAPEPRGRLDAWLAGGGAVLGAAGLVWALLAAVPTAPHAAVPPTPDWSRAEAALREPDFAGLTLERVADNQARLTGRIATRSHAQRVQSRTATWPVVPLWQVQVDESLAASAEDALQLAGLPWKAAVTGLGELRLDGDPTALSADRMARALAEVRAALPQVSKLVTPPLPAVASAAPTPADNPRMPALPSAGGEPGKRIVTLVSWGELPHIVTADGGRYFVGAVLPSGHRLLAVQPQALLLERDGRETRIDF